MATFDGINLIITLDSGVTSIDWIDVYSDWKNWLLSDPQNRGYPQAFRTTGGDPLNAFLNQGAYWFLRNDLGWRIKPPEEDITILAAGNLAVEDPDIDSFLPTTGAYTTQILGLQPITQGFSATLAEGLEYGLYGERVYIDPSSPYSGTEAPNGTSKQPVNNLADAKTIAENNGFEILEFKTNYTFTSGTNVDGYTLVGQGSAVTTFTFDLGATQIGSVARDAVVTGTVAGFREFNGCTLEDMTSVPNAVYGVVDVTECWIKGNLLFPAVFEGLIRFRRCMSSVAGSATPTIDVNGSNIDMLFRDLWGGAKFQNITSGTNNISIDYASGQIIFDNTNTLGDVYVRGSTTVTDNSGPLMNVNTSGTVSQGAIEETTGRKLQYLVEGDKGSYAVFGKVIYCSPYDGDDLESGEVREKAVQTVARAHELVEDNANDLIVLLATDPSGETTVDEVVSITKNGVQMRSSGGALKFKPTTVDVDTITVTGDRCGMGGFTVDTADTGTGNGIFIDGVDGFKVENVVLSGCNGYGLYAKDSSDGLIRDFEAVGTGNHSLLFENQSYCNLEGDVLIHYSGFASGGSGVRGIGTTHGIHLEASVDVHQCGGWGIYMDSTTQELYVNPNARIYSNVLGNVNNEGSEGNIGGYLAGQLNDIGKLVESDKGNYGGGNKRIYWDPTNGDDARDGNRQEHAVATWTRVDALVTSGANTVVFILNTDASGITTITERITISKDNVFLRGVGHNIQFRPTEAGDVITVSGDYCEVRDVYIENSGAASGDGVVVTGSRAQLYNIYAKYCKGDGFSISGNFLTAEKIRGAHNEFHGIAFTGAAKHSNVVDSGFDENDLDGMSLEDTANDINFFGSCTASYNLRYGANLAVGTFNNHFGSGVVIENNTTDDINDLGTNNSFLGEATITTQDKTDIANEVWLTTSGVQVLTDLTLVKKVESGRWKIDNNQMVFYDDDDVTPLLTFDLKDAAGLPAEEDVLERVPV